VICAADYYSLETPKISNPIFECSKCPTHADCPGGNILDLNPGYWRMSNDSSNIIECSNKESNCLGGTANFACALGHIGPLCESCDIVNNYSVAADYKCGRCGDQLINSIKIIAIFVFYVSKSKISIFFIKSFYFFFCS